MPQLRETQSLMVSLSCSRTRGREGGTHPKQTVTQFPYSPLLNFHCAITESPNKMKMKTPQNSRIGSRRISRILFHFMWVLAILRTAD